MSVAAPIFVEYAAKNISVQFAVVNDSLTTVDPEFERSRLYINGKELKEWSFYVGNGPRDGTFNALPPSRAVSFTYQLGEQFTKPGIYTLRWEGVQFRSQDLTFRVLPRP